MQNTSLSMPAICSLQLASAKPGCFKWILSDLGSNAPFKLKDCNKCPAIKVKADTSLRNASLSLKHECYPRETLRLSTRAGPGGILLMETTEYTANGCSKQPSVLVLSGEQRDLAEVACIAWTSTELIVPTLLVDIGIRLM